MKKRQGSGILERLSVVVQVISTIAFIAFLVSGGWPIALGIAFVYLVAKWILFGK